MEKYIEGMHKVGDAMAAVISAQVTREAQERKIQQATKEIKNSNLKKW